MATPLTPAQAEARTFHPASDVPRRIRNFTTREVTELIAFLVFAVLVTLALFAFTPLAGSFGFVVVAYLLFLATYFIAERARGDRQVGIDRVVTVIITSAAIITAIPLILIVFSVVQRGLRGLSLGFFTETMEGIAPDAPSTDGGGMHAILGTLVQVLLATLLCVPFGVLTAIYLNEVRGKLTPIVRPIVDAMSGVPSVVAGLFIYSVWVIGLGQGFSGFAASLALSVLMLPTVARASEEMLKLVDPGLRESSLALGSPQWRTVVQVVLPTARAGIVTAVILGIARVAGETAPLLMTAFGNDRANPQQTLSEPQEALPLFIYKQVTNAQGSAVDRAWAGALVLVGLVLILFVLARAVSKPTVKR
jgi:phosphate transport system permease protein